MKNNFNSRKCMVLIPSLIFAILLIYTTDDATAECNVCQANQAACINSTSFYLCFGDKIPNMDNLYHCKDGFDCTSLNAICVQSSSERRPSCGDTSLCGTCSAHRNHLFACLSRTAFQMCYGAIRPTGQIGNCPQDYLCDANSDAICMPERMVDSVTCDVVDDGNNGGSQTTTPGTGNGGGTTVPSDSLTPQQLCEQKLQVGLYPTEPVDVHCRRYIHCYYTKGIIQGVEYNCSPGTYFHIQQQQCVFNRPTYCM